ncbi:serine-rich adhesin for platelets isoform X2 [Episyrphus balteatus]|uniref:serine-rich adhesin for platelets isoform X2 n=1 Tax=Episyrphus balteatus TaxID=286459 RepID=UPI0024863022|nr:serine-rich adhesin for platelets isoform X2 [Episyrphus balteatus]
MSVFSDFQRLWMQRFPQSSLSDAWEQDVRASLERHKQKILEISKELEQETLYVEYLERLLSDVEKYKETGGDPTTLFEAATTTSNSQQQQAAAATTTMASIEESSLTSSVETAPTLTTVGLRDSLNGSSSGSHKMNDNKQVEESVNFRDDRDSHKNSASRESSNKRGSYKETTNNGSTSALDNRNSIKQLDSTTTTSTTTDDKDSRTEKDIKNMQIQKNGALNQCITELASGFKAAEINAEQLQQQSQKQKQQQIVGGGGGKSSSDSKNGGIDFAGGLDNSNHRSSSDNKPSHFVTVIEVNEPIIIVEPSNATTSTNNEHHQPTQQSVAAVAAEVVPVSCASATPETIVASDYASGENELTFSSFDRKSSKIEPSAPPMSPAMTSSTSVAAMSSASTSPSATLMTSSSSLIMSNIDAKKKVPPRPPPKYMRRVEPPTVPGGNIQLSSSPKRDLSSTTTVGNILYERGNSHIGITTTSSSGVSSGGSLSNNNSPSSSLERNIKPSDILRQKSSDSLEAKSFAGNRKTTPEMGKLGAGLKANDLVEEFGRKIAKTESLEKTKRSGDGITKLNHSPTGSLGKTSVGGGNGGVGASPTGSLSKFSSARYGNGVIAGDNASPNTGSLEKMKLNDGSSSNGRNGGNGSGGGGNFLETSLHSLGSKESLASQGNISEIIKSYESISSLSSDSTKAQNLDNEPYYDTVPMDNGDGEYVSLVPGGSVSTSSRDDLSTAGSTLPIGSGPYHHNQHLQHHHHSSSSRSHMSSQTSVVEPESPGRTSNYVNIDYFLHQRTETRSSSLDSDGEGDGPTQMRTTTHDEQTSQTPSALRKASGSARGNKIRSILNGIIESEKIYVECLNTMIQYKKAFHATHGTSQPVMRIDEENTIFYKIDELHAVHTDFLSDLRSIVRNEGGDVLVGDAFKRLADMFTLYSAFLHNYGQAIETVKKCSANNPQFKTIVSKIVLNYSEQNPPSMQTLEDLLHKPVARVQINALVFNDLLNETPPNHPDHQALRQAQKTIHAFLKQFNVVNQRLPSESNKNLRRMVKNSFIVELVDGHRKLRHLFLFNDVIACAKHKGSGRDRLEYELKWFIPLKDVATYEEDASSDFKESSPANILQLKTQACTVRDQILLEEKDDKKSRANGLRSGDKYRRKLADLESQLVLASPNLVFRIGNKATNKTMTFFLSSDFERTQWIESIKSLKDQLYNIPGANAINALDVHAYILAMQKGMKAEMGSYLLRNNNDESLLVGDLHMTVQGLTGLDHPADLYICIEVDSYGHYFRKATTKMVCRSTSPLWNESFVLELEGSQNVRILLYEARDMPLLRAKYILKLSRTWLQETPTNKVIKLSDTITLNTSLRFVPGEVTLRRVPTSKPGALFGAKMSQILK